MRTFDLAPLYRSTVGFDRLFSHARSASTPARRATRPTTSSGPARTTTASRVAVAGFTENELSIEAKENTLTIKGEKQAKEETNRRGALPGHRGPRVRARLPARRLRRGQGRVARERSPARRPRARDPRGEEAAPDRRSTATASRRWSRPRSLPKRAERLSRERSAPDFRGAFVLLARSSAAASARPALASGGALHASRRRIGRGEPAWRLGGAARRLRQWRASRPASRRRASPARLRCRLRRRRRRGALREALRRRRQQAVGRRAPRA